MQKNKFIGMQYLKESSIDKFKMSLSQFFLFLCVGLLALSIYFHLAYSVAPVYGSSMYPTINANFVPTNKSSQDRAVLNYIKNVNRGDIIVAKKTYETNEEYIYVIKRLIAIEGDSIEVNKYGDIYLNGKLLKEDYVNFNKSALYNKMNNLKIKKPEFFEGNKLIIPKGYVFYLGDNRGGSSDCSDYGPMPKKNIIAKVDYIVKSGENYYLSILKQIFN